MLAHNRPSFTISWQHIPLCQINPALSGIGQPDQVAAQQSVVYPAIMLLISPHHMKPQMQQLLRQRALARGLRVHGMPAEASHSPGLEILSLV